MRARLPYAEVLVAGFFALPVSAQAVPLSADEPAGEAVVEDASPEPTDVPASPRRGVQSQAPRPTPTWRDGRTRGFVAGSFDLGFLYVRPRLQFGYGKPHNEWLGLEVNPTVWFTAIGTYAGLRFAYRYANLRIGSRFTRPTQRSHLLIQNSYDRTALNRDASGDRRTYISNEAELTLNLPLGPGELSSETTVTYITRVNDDRYVYEDYLRIIAAVPWVWRQRLTYTLPLGVSRAVRVGIVAELIGVPGRDLVAFRGGVRLSIRASPRVEVRAAWIPAIIHRDTLGVRGGDFGLLGLRYRWATGGVTGVPLEESQ